MNEKSSVREEKRIIIPVRFFEKQGFYEVNVPVEYWAVFSEMLKMVGKIKERNITFKIRKV